MKGRCIGMYVFLNAFVIMTIAEICLSMKKCDVLINICTYRFGVRYLLV